MEEYFTKYERDSILKFKSSLTEYISNFFDVYDKFSLSLLERTWIAGGSFPCFYHYIPIVDIDFFFKDIESANNFVDVSYRYSYFSISDDYNKTVKRNDDKTKLLRSDRAITCMKIKPKFQFITSEKFIGNPVVILGTEFDFLHVTWFYDFAEDRFYISREIMDAIVHKRLVIKSITHSTKKRIEKWKKRGWHESENMHRKLKID